MYKKMKMSKMILNTLLKKFSVLVFDVVISQNIPINFIISFRLQFYSFFKRCYDCVFLIHLYGLQF